MAQEYYGVKLKDIFKGISHKGLYHFEKFVELPCGEFENSDYHIHFTISVSSIEDDALIEITFQSKTTIGRGEIEYTNILQSAWKKEEEKQQQLQQTIHLKKQLASRMLDYIETSVSNFEDFRIFAKSLRTPRRVFHESFYKHYDYEVLERIWDKVGFKASSSLNPKFLTTDMIGLENLFIDNVGGFRLPASKERGECDIELNGRKSPYPTLYEANYSQNKIVTIPWDEFLDIMGI